ncbi:Protein bassoon [Frankliniella fusca]|uniref:Protein bassoon n=1 Tax=Frankliniella fusca TaxID=407009 RepID=A0AAE1H660_9NEOP|nr:Protein bassoon [Frankliniella fusca]
MLCPLCMSGVTAETYISHLNQYHRSRKNVTLMCIIGGHVSCTTFNSVSAINKHFYKWHFKRPSLPGPSPDTPPASPPSSPLASPPASPPAPTSTSPPVSPPGRKATSHQIPASSSSPLHHFPSSTSQPDTQCSREEPNSAIQENIRVGDPVPTASSATTYQEKVPCNVEDESDEDYEDVSDDNEDEVSTAYCKAFKEKKGDFSCVNTSAADLLLFLRSKCTVPQNAVAGIQGKCEALVQKQILKFVDLMTSALCDKNIDINSIINVEKSVDSCSKIFTGINTKWKQDKYFEQKYEIVQPLRYFVGRDIRRKRRRKTGRRRNVFIENSLILNRITKFLEKLVNHSDFEKVTDPSLFNTDPNVLDSFTKGERFKKSTFFKKYPHAIRLVLYYDEFDSCDAIASKAGVHKLGAFYLGVDNIHPKFRSNLDFISLVALCKASTIKDVGMDIILKPILKELKKLEKGINLKNGKFLNASLIATIGDNLGIHALCGFKEGFTARRTCHHCMVDPEQLHTMTTESDNLLRTVHMYEEQIEEMTTASTKKKKEELSTEYGLNSKCSLNELETYHVIGSVVADIMHDQLEGCLQLQLKNLLYYLTTNEESVMTLEWFNEVLADFDYEYSELLNKPSLIRKGHLEEKDGKLHQNSSQIYQLAMFLPLILGPHVEVDDPHWDNYLMLIQICKLLFASEISLHEIDELADSIEIYLSVFQELYRDLIPKQHFMVHYPRLIRENGPLTLYSCMRMEAFHRNFKRKAYSLGNYVNIEVSLSKAYALEQAVLFFWKPDASYNLWTRD